MNIKSPYEAGTKSDRLSIPICPVCNMPLRAQQFGDATLHFCAAGHGAAIDGHMLAAHVHHTAHACGMDDVIDHAPRVSASSKPRQSPWFPIFAMEPCDVEGIEIDFCSIERGVWLDAPEIVQIANAMRRRPEPKTEYVSTDLAGFAFEIGGDVFVQTAINAADRVVNNGSRETVQAIDATGDVIGYGADFVAGIIEFIADAIP